MAATYENYIEHVTEDIQQCLSDMEAQPIIFVGSGFSIRYMQGPSWETLLSEVGKACPRIKEYAYYKQNFKDEIKIGTEFSNCFLDWAWNEGKENFPHELFSADQSSSIYLKHSVAEYLKKLLEEKWPLKLSRELEEELNLLAKINPYTVVTTNYDELLEKIFPEFTPIIGQKVIRSRTFDLGEIYKIHGSVNEPNSLILTSEDYDFFAEKQKYLSAKLLTLFAEHPIIFIGYRTNDPNIKAILSDIDAILCEENSVIPNIYILERDSKITNDSYPTREREILINSQRSVRVKSIISNDFRWVFSALASDQPIDAVSPKLLRSLLARNYDLIRHDIPKKTVEINLELLNRVSSSSDELAKLYGITVLEGLDKINIIYPYSLTDIANSLGFNKIWYHANKLIERIKEEKGINIKESDNKYHVAIKSGTKAYVHKYSAEAITLLEKVMNNEEYEVILH
ncbi:hypothetical protein VI06_11890 [Aquitalea magnusonii]|nr:hypothetical protein VI06_11890 [Aquitalea magnusonii]